MKQLSYRVLIPLAILAILAMVACSPVAAPPPSSGAPSSGAPAATSGPAAQPTEGGAPGEVIELNFWTLLTGSAGDNLNKQVEAFNQSQNRIKVINVNQGGYGPIQQKLMASIQAGNTPPVTMVDYLLVPFFAQAGILEPLDNWASKEDMADFIPGLLGDLKYDGKLYALPYNRSTQGLYYNKDIFKDVGLDPEKPPKTWDEFRDYAKKITDAGKGYYGSLAFFNRWMFEGSLLSWGGEINDADCNPTFQNQTGQDMMKFFQDMYYVDKSMAMQPTVSVSSSFSEQAVDFIQGKVGMLRWSTSTLATMGNLVKFNWGFAMLPAGAGGNAVTHGGANIAISSRASEKEKAAAWEFVRWLTSAEQSGQMHMKTGYMPSRYSVLSLPAVEEFHKTHPDYLVSVKQLEFAKPTACITRNVPQFNALMQTALEDMILKRADPATALGKAAAEVQKNVDDAKKAGTLIK